MGLNRRRVCESTLARFLERSPMRTGFKRVVIAEPEHEIAIAKAWKGPVVRAGGVVVEGLSALARRAGKNAERA